MRMLQQPCSARAARRALQAATQAASAARAAALRRRLPRCAAARTRCAAFSASPARGRSDADAAVEAAVLAWVDTFIIGLELCPFARAARRGTRVAVCRAASRERALEELLAELRTLDAAPLDAAATTLFVLPCDFAADWDDFMALHAAASDAAGAVSDAVQLVPFHPAALYGDDERDPGEYATRAPLPIIHLLRQADVRRAEADWEGGDIPSANADRLRGVGAGALAGMLSGFRQLAGLL